MNGAMAKSRWVRLAPLCLVVSGLLAYANSFEGEFVYDSISSIVDNEDIRQLWPPTWGYDSPGFHAATNSRPLVGLSLAANYALGDLQIGGYRFFNLLVHLLAGLVLYGLLRRTLEVGEDALAFCIALLWLLHPLNNQCINYVLQRSESLMGLCYLSVLYAARRGMDGEGRYWYGLALVAALLGMASKEVMATVPLAVLLYDRTFVAGSFAAAWRERRWWYGGLVSTVLLLVALQWSRPHGDSIGFASSVGTWQYLLNQADVLITYLLKTIWPSPLLLDYGRPLALSFRDVYLEALAVVGLLAATLVALRYWPRVGFAAAWFFLLLAPTSSFVPMMGEVGAERRMYLPLIGVLVLLVGAVRTVVQRWFAPRIWLGVLVVWALALGWATMERNRDYYSAVGVWQTAVEGAPDNYRAHTNLANVLQQKGDLTGALEHYQSAIELGPAQPRTHYNLGQLLQVQKKQVLAEVQFERVVEFEKDYRLQSAGQILNEYQYAELAPVFAAAYYKLARAEGQRRDYAAATIHLRRALLLAPDHVEAHNNLGTMLALQKDYRGAVFHYQEALRLRPEYARAQENLTRARTYLKIHTGDIPTAKEDESGD
jgi:protein O-mannosyl-transferase